MKYTKEEVLNYLGVSCSPQDYIIHSFKKNGISYKVALVGERVFQLETITDIQGETWEYFKIIVTYSMEDDIFSKYYPTIAVCEGLVDDLVKLESNSVALFVFTSRKQKRMSKEVNESIMETYGLNPQDICVLVHMNKPGFISNVKGLIAPDDRMDMARRFYTSTEIIDYLNKLVDTEELNFNIDCLVTYNPNRPDATVEPLEEVKDIITKELKSLL